MCICESCAYVYKPGSGCRQYQHLAAARDDAQLAAGDHMNGMTERNRNYARIAKRLIETEPAFEEIRDSGVRIAYLSSQEEKKKGGKIVLGECVLVKDQYKWCVPYDFMIFIYEPNIIGLTRKQKRILIMHELMHIGIDADSDDIKFKIIPHDIEEFQKIIDRYGLNWETE